MRVRLGQKFHFVCMRFFQNKNWGVVEDRVYWKKMAWLDNERLWRPLERKMQRRNGVH